MTDVSGCRDAARVRRGESDVMNDVGGERIAERASAQGIARVHDFSSAEAATDVPARAEPAPLTHRERRIIVMAMMMPVFMGSIDQSILASALPTIGRVFGDVHDLPWVITSYLIASTALTPLYGKFADIHGRRASLMVALGIYMMGSLISAASTSLVMLICRPHRAGLRRRRPCDNIADGLGRYCAAKGSRQVLRLFLDRLHQCGRTWSGAGRMDLPASALVADLSVEISILSDCRGAVVERAAPAAALRPAASARCHRRHTDHGGKHVLHAGAQSRRRALSVAVGARARALGQRASAGRCLRDAAAHRRRAAHPGCRSGRSDRADRHVDPLLRLGVADRAEHFPADVSAERAWLVADRRGTKPHHPDGNVEHQRRADQSAHRSGKALQGAADSVSGRRHRRGARAWPIGPRL